MDITGRFVSMGHQLTNEQLAEASRRRAQAEMQKNKDPKQMDKEVKEAIAMNTRYDIHGDKIK